jgi:hypothetical protein
MIFLNLFIAIILQGFEDMTESDRVEVKTEMTEYFRDKWAFCDPDATGLIELSEFPTLLLLLGEPLGWSEEFKDDLELQEAFLDDIQLPVYDDSKIHFADVLENLAMMVVVKAELEEQV